MAEVLKSVIAVIGIDIGKNSFHVVGLDGRGAVALRQRWSRGQVEARLANMPPCLIGWRCSVGETVKDTPVRMRWGLPCRIYSAQYFGRNRAMARRARQKAVQAFWPFLATPLAPTGTLAPQHLSVPAPISAARRGFRARGR